jgi:dTDP-L-rhamnose 4-epimerase
VHISDIVAALVTALHADIPSGTVMNLGAGEGTSVNRLARELLNASGFSVPMRITGQFRIGDIRHCFADISQARKAIGYQPKVSLSEGLIRFCDWARQQPIHEDKLGQATDELRKRGLAT